MCYFADASADLVCKLTIMNHSCFLQLYNGGTALSISVRKGHTAVASLLRHWSLTIPRRLATYAYILHAIDLEEGRATQDEPVKELLQRLARTPDDIVRVIVLFVGDGGDAEEELRLEKEERRLEEQRQATATYAEWERSSSRGWWCAFC